ncbi:uncharacterized protein A4U43_C05F20140 [Asparagus officinalis]|uniref:FBD domain-containing protein n=1 Tax=Asparagus officinalis TaxID=4686 RepID=A0A5P1EVI3_ASPOF|nr:uncharacterized protein A4U43_C05F20140 [Asparagus officinalis]
MWPKEGHSYIVTRLLRCYLELKTLKISFIDYNWGYPNDIFDEERENYPKPPDILSGEMVHRNLRMLELKGCKGYGDELRTMKLLLQTGVALEKFIVDISKDEESWTVDDIQALPRPSNIETKINIY